MGAYSCRVLSRRLGSLMLPALMLATAGSMLHAQSPVLPPDVELSSTADAAVALPGTPELHPAAEPPAGVISGTVLDPNGAEVQGATVTLEGVESKEHSATTGDDGFFRFSSVGAGAMKVTVNAKGFSSWSTGVMLQPNENRDLPPVQLEMAMSTTEIVVVSTRGEIAEEQMRAEERQRVLGAIPNFYVSYQWDAEPLSSVQKYRLAWRTSIDPVSVAISAGIAGVEQSQNTFSGYGQGTLGYAKRFGASYMDGLVGTFLADAVLPSLLRQDPRYFYKGTGSIRSRALYAIASVVICKGDNGRWQPNYSNVLGNLAAAGISNLYYPASSRNGAELTIQNSLIGTAAGAVGTLFQEFLVKKISRGVPQ